MVLDCDSLNKEVGLDALRKVFLITQIPSQEKITFCFNLSQDKPYRFWAIFKRLGLVALHGGGKRYSPVGVADYLREMENNLLRVFFATTPEVWILEEEYGTLQHIIEVLYTLTYHQHQEGKKYPHQSSGKGV